MIQGLMKSFTVAAFSLFSLLISSTSFAKEGDGEKKEGFNAQKVIFGHILDAHEFHFFDIINKDGSHIPVGIPLPVILYSPQKGFDVFMSSKFHHGEHDYKGYRLLTEEHIEEFTKEGADEKAEYFNRHQDKLNSKWHPRWIEDMPPVIFS